MKHLRILSLTLAFLLALSILPAALATDNPAGETIQENNGTIAVNNGTIVTNAGTVESNEGTIETNDYGEVLTNESSGVITTNQNPGIVTKNSGTISTNTGSVASNEGTIETNDHGDVSINESSGVITTNQNAGIVNENYGTVETNKKSEGTYPSVVAWNYGIIGTNEDEVTVNNSTITENNGTVTENFGTITENDGTVPVNFGTIGTNEGTVEKNQVSADGKKQGTITTNAKSGTVTENFSTIGANEGTVTGNIGTITENEGTVEKNEISENGSVQGTITTNAESGTVTENRGIIGTNDGTVTENKRTKIKTGESPVTYTIVNGMIFNNNGEISTNEGIVCNNHGDIDVNKWGVFVNRQDGTVTNDKDAEDAEEAGVLINYGIVYNAMVLEDDESGSPFGEMCIVGDDTLIGITYAREGAEVEPGEFLAAILGACGEVELNPVEQWVYSSGEAYVIQDYEAFEQFLGKIESGKAFVKWEGSDGKTYKPGERYSDLSPLQLTAIIEAIKKAEKKSASKGPSLTIIVNEDGSFTPKGGSINNFIAVTVDEELVDPANYTLTVDENGRLKLLFTDAYLQTLSAGEHAVMMCFANGTSRSTLTV